MHEHKQRYTFEFWEENEYLCTVSLNGQGLHQVYNALAAAGAARLIGISPHAIAVGLGLFTGVGRRFERLGKFEDRHVLCDFAHHPKEIENVISVAKKVEKGDILVVFQPHTYSRTRYLFDQFVECLQGQKVILLPTFAARESSETDEVIRLQENIKNSFYASNEKELKNLILQNSKEGDTLLFLGAGDIYERAKTLCKTP